mgnify:CR=1 FL=1
MAIRFPLVSAEANAKYWNTGFHKYQGLSSSVCNQKGHSEIMNLQKKMNIQSFFPS